MFLDRRTTLITGKCKATGEIEGPEGKPVRYLDCYGTGWTSITVSQLFDLFEKEQQRRHDR
jgi:hypothetical protein